MHGKSAIAGVLALVAAGAALTFAALYFFLTSTRATPPRPPAGHGPVSPQAAAPHGAPGEMDAMVAKLAERLAADPDDGEGWAMLGRSYVAQERFAEAARAFERAAALLPRNADLLVDYADVLARERQGDLRGEPAQLVRRALQIDPKHLKGLALAGTEAFRRGDFGTAIGYWKTALAAAPPDSGFIPVLRSGIADADKRLGKGSVAP